MGRTKRRRLRQRKAIPSKSLDSDLDIINLKTWMSNKGWQNETKLQLAEFPETGRGVSSKKSLHKNDVIIKVPFNILITYQTILESELMKMLTEPYLKFHDYLSLFLIFEKHKANKSLWRVYIDSLPSSIPSLLWTSSLEEIELFPEEMRKVALKRRSDFIESWSRVRESIAPGQNCFHCKKPLDCVIQEDIFKWAYILVNTRAVYVDPQAVTRVHSHKMDEQNNFRTNCLSDEPSMALCPFLDMFNHSFTTKTDADVICDQGQYFYQLRTHSNYKKYQQIFISYGSHDNVKLLIEYGFYIPENSLDCLHLEFRRVLDVLKLKLDQRQYKYINEHDFKSNLFISRNGGVSHNLKRLLFVAKNKDLKYYNQYVYSDLDDHFRVDDYKDELGQLLNDKFESRMRCMERLSANRNLSELVLSFSNYELKFIELCLLDFNER